MTYVAFTEYQTAKNEIIGGVEYKEDSIFPNQYRMMSKTYSTVNSGNFYEVTDSATGITEFWSTKHSESRYYNPCICDETVTDEPETTGQEKEAATLPAYGAMLAENIKTKYRMDFSKLTHFEKYVLDQGWQFKTEEELRAGYDRFWKCMHEILITEDEFIEEAGLGIKTFSQWNEETARTVYNTLVELLKAKKLNAVDVYRYAHYKWCLRKPDAIIAYQEGCNNKWEVNNCDTEVSEDKAITAVNSEWGFEAGRIQIIGIPYYEATDYQYIRFDCAHMTWLWKNGNLYQVYE